MTGLISSSQRTGLLSLHTLQQESATFSFPRNASFKYTVASDTHFVLCPQCFKAGLVEDCGSYRPDWMICVTLGKINSRVIFFIFSLSVCSPLSYNFLRSSQIDGLCSTLIGEFLLFQINALPVKHFNCIRKFRVVDDIKAKSCFDLT